MPTMPVKIAVLGGGVFAQNTFAPILKSLQEALVVAVWSRSEGSATALLSRVKEFSPEAVSYHDDDGLDELLSTADVEAVLVAVAPQGILELTKKCLAAGKHVLSEKPAGPSLIAVQEMLHWVGMLPDSPLWCVEENYRSEPAFLRAAELVAAGTLGPIARLDVAFDFPMLPGNRYFGSGWRRDQEGLPGGFLMESSVHYLAALRELARAAGWGEAVAASATTMHVRQDLTPPDTLVGMVRFESGGGASVSISFAGFTSLRSVSAIGTQGTVEARQGRWHHTNRGSYEVVYQRAGEAAPTTEALPLSGVEKAIASFLRCVGAGLTGSATGAAAAAAGQPAVGGEGTGGELAEHARRVSAVEAARDLALIEALLKSSQMGGQLVPVAQVA